MARDISTLKKILWEQFETAVERNPDYEDSDDTAENTPFNPTMENLQSIAQLAEAIVPVEREQRAAAREQRTIQRQQRDDNERKNGLTLPGKP